MFSLSCIPRGYFSKWYFELASTLTPQVYRCDFTWTFGSLIFFAQCKGNYDTLELWISHLWLRIPGTGFRPLSVDLGFWFQSLVGFRIPLAVLRIPKPGIPDFRSKNFSDSEIQIGSHGAIFWEVSYNVEPAMCSLDYDFSTVLSI